MSFLQKVLYILQSIGQAILRGLFAVGAAFKRFGLRIRDGFVKFGRRVAKIAVGFARGVVAFPKKFVGFWKAFGLEVAHFFRNLPTAFRSKDGVADLLIGTGAVVIWCMPVFIVIYVIAWVNNRNKQNLPRRSAREIFYTAGDFCIAKTTR